MRKTKQKTRKELRAQLARDMAAVLANPETPNIIYNGLGSAINDLFNGLRHPKVDESEQYLAMLLDEAANEEKGGAR